MLDAYLSLLCDEGERAATMEAIAAKAGVSKGGLLYHFASKDALAEALIESCEQLVLEDLELMAAAEEGAAVYFVRTSAEYNTDYDRHLVAMHRLAQAGVAGAVAQIESTETRWLQLLIEDMEDENLARMVMLMGEGLYAYASMPGGWYERNFDGSLPQLLQLVPHLKKLSSIN